MNLKQTRIFRPCCRAGQFQQGGAHPRHRPAGAVPARCGCWKPTCTPRCCSAPERGVWWLTEAGKRLFDHSIGILQLVRVRGGHRILARRTGRPSGRRSAAQHGKAADAAAGGGIPPCAAEGAAIVEGLSTHLSEWISIGRVDLGCCTTPSRRSPSRSRWCWTSRSVRSARRGRSRQEVSRHGTARLAELTRIPLILPEQPSCRKLIETQAALASGHKLNVDLEISSVQSILDSGTRRLRSCRADALAAAASGDPVCLSPAHAGGAPAHHQHVVPAGVRAQSRRRRPRSASSPGCCASSSAADEQTHNKNAIGPGGEVERRLAMRRHCRQNRPSILWRCPHATTITDMTTRIAGISFDGDASGAGRPGGRLSAAQRHRGRLCRWGRMRPCGAGRRGFRRGGARRRCDRSFVASGHVVADSRRDLVRSGVAVCGTQRLRTAGHRIGRCFALRRAVRAHARNIPPA
ncbi:MAG: hypothetical protein M5R42_05600 [Rhodocyclaceae bacterium]|nr:hypothetical protein [Rhodocyclaceae bacterium]